jgi:hypothetical protein
MQEKKADQNQKGNERERDNPDNKGGWFLGIFKFTIQGWYF